jgi:hypothetical protein
MSSTMSTLPCKLLMSYCFVLKAKMQSSPVQRADALTVTWLSAVTVSSSWENTIKLLDPLLLHINYMYLCRDYVRHINFTIFSGLFSTPFMFFLLLSLFFSSFFPFSKHKLKFRLQSYGTWVRKQLIVGLAWEKSARSWQITGEWTEGINLK